MCTSQHSGAGKPLTCPYTEPNALLQWRASLFLLLWPCNWHQGGDVTLSLCPVCSEQGSALGTNRWYVGGRSIDKLTFTWSLQRLMHMLYQPLPIDCFRGVQFLPLDHHSPELHCCVSPGTATGSLNMVTVHMAGMGSASKEVCCCACPGWGGLQSASCHGSSGDGALHLPPS